ncbi:VCBS repeat-containing protein [Lentiprolixibacter aurantiacus]|uniref:VCBS repeat-containing protein n=1 Tax=Lentiprolixibacter aurantiacus TaxID=2993939 RepID=A0AAE3MLG8_9FLAO|nr:VCBS repeat-containing protein [Lentiprolixibacter aurantiacus]MCX2719593.1 VCBS repeat-containing protein [Lentiprolixibacter aurantiacus]
MAKNIGGNVMADKKSLHPVFTFLLLGLLFSCAKPKQDQLFREVLPKDSGIVFTNTLTESYAHNMLMFSNFYTGAGVGVLDVNNDGLQDLLFGGNQVSSKLFLNKGGLRFQDITQNAGLETDRWITGISVVDINADGYDDIYLSVSGFINSGNTENLLFVNNKDNTFTEKAAVYGLNEKAQTTHTSFFDYDRDGDLDAFMAINPTDFTLYYMNRVKKPAVNGEATSTDRLYENLGNGKFREVSRKAGILFEGYSLGLNTSDFNGDGWIDIYVTNDFITNDILYLNKGDGTFENVLKTSLDVTSYASMGNDVADINNDGLLDLYTLDMLPEDSYREKTLVTTTNYNFYQMVLNMGYHPQFSRNVLQLNNGDGTFSEIGHLAGISRTDWSWSPLFVDFDNDGLKDLYVTNGFRRELGNLDYINYDEFSPFVNPGSDIKRQIEEINNTPGIPLANYSFKNQGDLNFVNTTKEWGFDKPTYSNGSAVGDFDNDGDMDLVISNIDMPAMFYENLSNGKDNHFVKVKLQYQGENLNGIGARVYLEGKDDQQLVELNPYRGYLSSCERTIHFGLGTAKGEKRLKVVWPNSEISYHEISQADSLLFIAYSDIVPVMEQKELPLTEPLFTDITDASGLNFVHSENTQVDFHQQFLLPHQHSKLGPGLAVADVNGDGIEDCFIGGAKGQSGRLFLQQRDGTFKNAGNSFDIQYEDMGCLFFDFDGDGDQDLYVASGGASAQGESDRFQDRLYENDGAGNFKRHQTALPEFNFSTAAVNAADFDEDGDLDLFVGGRVIPGSYPLTPPSFILVNEDGRFIDRTSEVAPELSEIGMVSQGIWSDFDADNDLDLIVVGEWMPVTVMENRDGKFVNKTEELQLGKTNGFWNSITPSDLNADGRIDYLLGNLGANNQYKIDEDTPLVLKAKDFDQNGSVDPILFKQYIDGFRPVPSRDAFLSQLPNMRLKYPNYESYALVDQENLFEDPEAWEADMELKSYTAHHSVLLNHGMDSLILSKLPNNSQFAPLFGALAIDVNADASDELFMTGNLFSNNVIDGPFCSFIGAYMEYSSDEIKVHRGNTKNGFVLKGDRKALGLIQMANGSLAVISTRNDDSLNLLQINVPFNTRKFRPEESKAIIRLANGKEIVREAYYGSGYLSHSSRVLLLPESWVEIRFFSREGLTRTINREDS